MSADADRKTCGHTFYGKTCSNCRVAQLTAELAEARTRFLEAEMRHRVGCPMYMGKSGGECTCGVILLNLERAAHERTKAELAELDHSYDALDADVRIALGIGEDGDIAESCRSVKCERDAAKAELAEAHWRLNDADGALQDAGTPVVEERFDEAIQRLHGERDAAIARQQAAQTEAAAMRGLLKCSGGCGNPPTCYGTYEGGGVEGFCCDECCGHGNEDGWCKPIGEADRAIAARVPLWRELEERGWSFVDDVHADLDGEAMVVDRDMLRALRETLESLAALDPEKLDEKGGAT